MFSACQNYLRELTDWFGNGWNQFWYTPTDGWQLVWLRQIVSIVAFVWLASFSFELVAMFGESGWMSREVVHQATTNGSLNQSAPGFSHLFLFESNALLWATHLLSLVVVGAMMLGVAPRVTTALTFLVVLSYVHRAPVVTTAFETVLCMLLLYLSFGPNRNIASLRTNAVGSVNDERHWLNNLATRLIQVHLVGIYVLIAASKLGTPDWWSGAATWYLLNDEQHRLLKLDFITSSSHLMDLVAHTWVAFELLFPVLVWCRKLTPLVITISVLIWAFTAIVTGQIGYCVLMAAANLAFAAPVYGPSQTSASRKRSTTKSDQKATEAMATSKP